MKTKVFIDGSEGTTGLRIHERLDNRDDIELLTIAPELRKDPAERSRLINSSDITFLFSPSEIQLVQGKLSPSPCQMLLLRKHLLFHLQSIYIKYCFLLM